MESRPKLAQIARPLAEYAREVRAALPREAFAPARSRIAWLGIHLTLVIGGIVLLGRGVGPWPLALAISGVIGFSFAGLAFLGHEVMHGAVIRGRWPIFATGLLCFLPFVLSPRIWTAWHNGVHHNHTMKPGMDPDAYPTLEQYQGSALLRHVTDTYALGRGNPLGVLMLLLGFSVQSLHVLASARTTLRMSRRNHRISIAHTILGVAVWTSVGLAVGPGAFALAYVVPIMVANAMVMAYISSNHNLSPLTDINDPLLNSLSVTAPRWYEIATLSFGMHVEHHVLPTVSSRHATLIRDVLIARWPERYQSMPLSQALVALARTGRVYKDATTLHDPRTGRDWPTLLPRDRAAAMPRSAAPPPRAEEPRIGALGS